MDHEFCLSLDYLSLMYELIGPRTGKLDPDVGYGPDPIRKPAQLNCANNFDVAAGRTSGTRYVSTAGVMIIDSDEDEGEGEGGNADEDDDDDNDDEDDKDGNYNPNKAPRSSGGRDSFRL